MAHSKTEFELKLVGPACDVAAVPRLARLDPLAVASGAWDRLVSTYYDSANGRLRAAGLSLRIREEAGVKTLTAKLTPPGGGALYRLESERILDGAAVGFCTGNPEIDDIIGAEIEDLAPIARTTTDRWSRLLHAGGALIEASAEIGRAENAAEGRSAPLAEVELELMKGDPAALFDLAEEIIGEFDGRLRLSVEPKLDRALRAGAAPRLAKQGRPAFADGAVAADVLGEALKQIAARIVEAAALAADAHDSDGARQLRVALRRLRAAERIFRKALGGEDLKTLAAKAKALAALAGEARDLDVFIEHSLPLAPRDAALCARLDSDRAERWAAAAAAMSDRAFGAFALDLFRAAYLQPWRAPAGKRLAAPARQYADDELEKRWRKLADCAAGVEFADPASLHALRIELKRLRYAAQFFRDFYPGEARKPFFAAMSALQEAFGAVNDAVVAQRIAQDAGAGRGAETARAAGFIAGYRGAEAAAAARAIEAKWRDFSSAAPYWRAVDDHPSSAP